MRLKLDENVPVTAATLLSARGFDVDTVRDEGLTGHSDDAVRRPAQSEGRFFITQDLDFSDARKFAPGTHHGILLVRLPDVEQMASELLSRCVALRRGGAKLDSLRCGCDAKQGSRYPATRAMSGLQASCVIILCARKAPGYVAASAPRSTGITTAHGIRSCSSRSA